MMHSYLGLSWTLPLNLKTISHLFEVKAAPVDVLAPIKVNVLYRELYEVVPNSLLGFYYNYSVKLTNKLCFFKTKYAQNSF